MVRCRYCQAFQLVKECVRGRGAWVEWSLLPPVEDARMNVVATSGKQAEGRQRGLGGGVLLSTPPTPPAGPYEVSLQGT